MTNIPLRIDRVNFKNIENINFYLNEEMSRIIYLENEQHEVNKDKIINDSCNLYECLSKLREIKTHNPRLAIDKLNLILLELNGSPKGIYDEISQLHSQLIYNENKKDEMISDLKHRYEKFVESEIQSKMLDYLNILGKCKLYLEYSTVLQENFQNYLQSSLVMLKNSYSKKLEKISNNSLDVFSENIYDITRITIQETNTFLNVKVEDFYDMNPIEIEYSFYNEVLIDELEIDDINIDLDDEITLTENIPSNVCWELQK